MCFPLFVRSFLAPKTLVKIQKAPMQSPSKMLSLHQNTNSHTVESQYTKHTTVDPSPHSSGSLPTYSSLYIAPTGPASEIPLQNLPQDTQPSTQSSTQPSSTQPSPIAFPPQTYPPALHPYLPYQTYLPPSLPISSNQTQKQGGFLKFKSTHFNWCFGVGGVLIVIVIVGIVVLHFVQKN